MSNNHTVVMNESVHEFFYTIGVATTASFAYYIWNNLYPISVERLIADTAWFGIKLQTKTEMTFSKIEKFLYPWFATVIPEEERHDVKFYKDGRLVTSMTYLCALKYEEDDFAEDYNKVTYEVHDDKGNNLVMLRDNVNDIMDKGLKKSNVNFISVSIKQDGEDDIEVDLRKKGDIYMVGNELFSKSFFRWCLCDKYDLDDKNYTVSTIDDNVNMVAFNKNQYIVLNENGYDVKTIECELKETESKNDESDKKLETGFFSWFSNTKAKEQ